MLDIINIIQGFKSYASKNYSSTLSDIELLNVKMEITVILYNELTDGELILL